MRLLFTFSSIKPRAVHESCCPQRPPGLVKIPVKGKQPWCSVARTSETPRLGLAEFGARGHSWE